MILVIAHTKRKSAAANAYAFTSTNLTRFDRTLPGHKREMTTLACLVEYFWLAHTCSIDSWQSVTQPNKAPF